MNLDKRAEKISQAVIKLRELASNSSKLCDYCKYQGCKECEDCVIEEDVGFEFEWDEK